MTRYITQRLMVGLLTAFIVSIFIFVPLRTAPLDERHSANIIIAIHPTDIGNPEIMKHLEELRKELGLYRPPLHIQYIHWLSGWFTGDWEKPYWKSYRYEGEGWEHFVRKLPITLQLVVMAQALVAFVGVPAGIVMALRRNTRVDHIGRTICRAGLALPVFWTATLLLLAGPYWLGWSPRLGHNPLLEDPLGNLDQFIFPALALCYVSCAAVALMMRSSTLGMLRQDYVQTTPASGLGRSAVVFLHALKNVLAPAVITMGFAFPAILGGVLIVEPLFGLEGVGNMLVKAALSEDFPIVESLALFFAVWVIAANALVDILCGRLDANARSTRKSPREEWDHLANPVRLA